MVTEKNAEQFILQQLDKMIASNYSSLLEIPDTHVWKVTDYVREISSKERDALFTAFITNGLFLLFPDRNPNLHAGKSGRHDAYQRFCDALLRRSDYKYTDVRTLRMLLGDLGSSSPHRFSVETPIEVLAQAKLIVPTSASEIRKEVRKKFAERFDARAENGGGGAWNYFGRFQHRDFQVCIDYGGRSAQLRYEVFYEDPETGLRANRLNYEGLLGFGHGDWDYITATNLDHVIILLCDLIQDLVTIPERLVSFS